MSEEDIVKAALELPGQRRLAIAELLLDSVEDEQSAEHKAAWLAELERRHRSYREGRGRSYTKDEANRLIFGGRDERSSAAS